MSKPPSVFVIGSSLTLAVHPFMKEMCAGRLNYARKGEEGDGIAKALADLDTPQGAAAGDSSKVLAYLRELEKTDFAPDLVLLSVGFHDLRKNVDSGAYQVALDQFTQNVGEILQWFSRRKIQLVWMRIGPLDEGIHNSRSKAFHRYEADVDAYNRAAEAMLQPASIPILDLPGFTRALGPLPQLVRDHIHFHEPIARLQAAHIVGFLEGLAGGRG